MKNLALLLVMMFGFSLYAFAQSSPVAVPVTPAPVAAASGPVVAPAVNAPVSASFIGIVIAIVAGLNVLLSSLQQIFSALSKSEPGWLQSVSKVVLFVAKYLGSNPDVASSKASPPIA